MSKTVLLVEDDDLIRGGLSRVLQEKGLQVVEAENGKKGLDKALASRIDLVVTDVVMPEMDGLTMLAELRKDEAGRSLPVIILSNDEETDSLNKAMEAGVTVYLSKAVSDAETIANQIIIALGE